MVEWSLQDAKNRFSAVVNAALDGVPQRVTRRGRPAVVVLAVDEYERLRHIEKTNAPTFGELLLDIPRDGQGFERLVLAPRSLADVPDSPELREDIGYGPPTSEPDHSLDL